MKGIYLAAFRAIHPGYDIVYQDIDGSRDIGGDMMDVNLSEYDFIIATPPCNWWSKANWRKDVSPYALQTKHLLIDILHKLVKLSKPFIVENVRNRKRFNEYGLFDLGVLVYECGRHTYWTNVCLDLSNVNQVAKTDFVNGRKRYLTSQNLPRYKRQGGKDVAEVIDIFLENIMKRR